MILKVHGLGSGRYTLDILNSDNKIEENIAYNVDSKTVQSIIKTIHKLHRLEYLNVSELKVLGLDGKEIGEF